LADEGRGCSKHPGFNLGINRTLPLRIVSFRSLVGTVRENSSARMFAAWPRLIAGLFWFEQRCQSQTLKFTTDCPRSGCFVLNKRRMRDITQLVTITLAVAMR
jgi:hypothetical protein